MLEWDGLLDSIYEAAFLPEVWPIALDAVSSVAGATAGIMFAASTRFSGWQASAPLMEVGRSFFEDGWFSCNNRMPILARCNHAGFLRDSDFFDDDALSADPMQAQLLVPSGFGREIATLIPTSSGENIVFSFHRSISAGRFNDPAVQRLDRLRPHIARAAFLSARLGMDRMKAAVELLDTVGLAAAIIGQKGNVLASNRLLDAVPQIFPQAFSRLGLRPQHAQRRFDEAISCIVQGKTGQLLSILLTAGGGIPDAVLHIVPLRREARDLMPGAQAVIVVTPGHSEISPSIDLLHGLFDLTAGEARVARGLLNNNIRQLAEGSNVSMETVRTQLKSVLRKTSMHSQTNLIALLTRLAFVDGSRRVRIE
jgi:DNA-binding CsgD family transcriptional regulator